MAERQPVLLLHGVWLRGVSLLPLARRLREAGFDARTFEHASVLGGPEPTLKRLRHRLAGFDGQQVHLVGHSLGGVLSVLAAAEPELPIGRIVCLGSPLCGSRIASDISSRRWLSPLLGRSRTLLCNGPGKLPPGKEIGMIAGTLGIGVGRWLGNLGAQHDGTVAVAETRCEGLADHLCLRASHTGLLLSRAVALQTAHFLESGHFEALAPVAGAEVP